MERFVLLLVLTGAALVIAAVLRRRDADEPVATGHHVPGQLHRRDFVRPDAEWLAVVFTSATCDSCSGVWSKVAVLDSDIVATQEVEVSASRDLHDRYGIDGVPTTVIADADGVVRASFLGPATATDLWAAVAELRTPGSVPSGCSTHDHVHPDTAD